MLTGSLEMAKRRAVITTVSIMAIGAWTSASLQQKKVLWLALLPLLLFLYCYQHSYSHCYLILGQELLNSGYAFWPFSLNKYDNPASTTLLHPTNGWQGIREYNPHIIPIYYIPFFPTNPPARHAKCRRIQLATAVSGTTMLTPSRCVPSRLLAPRL